MMKNRKYLWTAVLVATVVLTLLLAGCGPSTQLTYRVTGTASEAAVKYTNAEGELEETTVNLPWETTLKVGNEFRFDLTVTNQSDSGTVTCEALIDGKVLGEADSNTSVSCSGSFRKQGGSITTSFASAAAPSAGEHLNRGVDYAKQGQLDKAIAEFEEAIKLDPNYVEAHVNLGIGYAKQGMFDKAIAAYEEAIRLDPDIAEAHYNLGLAYAKQGMFDKAIPQYEEALKLNPDDADTHWNLGAAYADQGQADKAITEYKAAIELDPNIAEVHYDLGVVYYKQGELNEAAAEFEEAVKLDPNYVKAHVNLGSAYVGLDKLDEAIAEYQEVIRIDPDFAEAHKGLGVVYSQQGKAEEAILELETYLQLAPDAPDRAAAEQEIARLKESAAGQAPEYRNAVVGYSVLYPKGWYYHESGTVVKFAESQAALEVPAKDAIREVPVVFFNAGPLTNVAENTGVAETTDDPAEFLQAIAKDIGSQAGEIETAKIASYPAAAADILGTYQGTPHTGGLAVVLVEERVVYGVALVPSDQWDAFRPTFIAMVNSLSFFEP
jgi:tetratricopeptide (TPR) repeat protein